jgi:hypothetical protein
LRKKIYKLNKENKMPVNIHGKEYATVNERVEQFRTEFPLWTIESEITHHVGKEVIIKASIKDEQGRVVSTGMAHETQGAGHINKTSHIENAETSAVGRALAFFKYAGDSIASADEVQNAIQQQEPELTAEQEAELSRFQHDFNEITMQPLCEEYWNEIKKLIPETDPLYPHLKTMYAFRWKALK